MQTYQGTGYPNGFNPNTQKPIDVRLVVPTLADRNLIEYTYPTMPVSVLGAAVNVGGVLTYPNMTHWRCMVAKNPTFGGPSTTDADWKRDSAPASLTQGGYKGTWDANDNVPELRGITPDGVSLRASLVPGDFYKVSVTGSQRVDGIQGWNVNDSLFWNGSSFDKFENTNPDAILPLYREAEGARFQADVLDLIRLNALSEWAPGTNYGRNSYVKHTYQDNGKPYVDTFVATSDLTAATAALPTATTPNPGWQLISTTNGAKLGGTAVQNDARGKAATGAFVPATPTPGEYLSPEQIDARIKQYGGQNGGPLLGGDAATFLTADPSETPRN